MKKQGFYSQVFKISILTVLIYSHSTQVNAASQFVSTLEIEETFLNTKQAADDESGAATTIAPGISYLLTTPSASISVLYAIESIHYTSLDRSDQTQANLDLAAEITHQPGRWRTEIFGNIEQTNGDIDGAQSFGNDIFSDDSEEIRTLEANTTLTGRWGSTVQYQSVLGVDAADIENSDETQGANLGISLDNFRSVGIFTWGSVLASQVAEVDGGDREQIDSLALNLNYRLNYRWQLFTDLTTYETDEDEQNLDGILVGIFWTPKSNTSIRLGAGEFDDNESYSLNVIVTQSNLQFTASYVEEITTARSETLNELSEDLFSTLTDQSISIDPVLQQRADIGVTVQGRLSTFGINLFDYTRDPIGAGDEEKGSGIELSFSRELPRLATVGVDVTGERTELVETNDLAEIEIYYRKRQTQNIDVGVNLNYSELDSSLPENEYEQTELGFSMLVRF